jgi:hypothetical protein
MKNYFKIKHLKEHNFGYWEHWWRAMSCSIALFIHAWCPWWFKNYTSNKLKEENCDTNNKRL